MASLELEEKKEAVRLTRLNVVHQAKHWKDCLFNDRGRWSKSEEVKSAENYLLAILEKLEAAELALVAQICDYDEKVK